MGVLEIQCHHLFPCFINLHLVTSRLFVVMMIQFALRCSSASGILQVIYKNESSTYIVVPRNTMQHLFNILTLLFSQQRDWHLMEFVSYSNCVCTLSSLPAVHIYMVLRISENCKLSKKKKKRKLWYHIRRKFDKKQQHHAPDLITAGIKLFCRTQECLRYTVYLSLKVWSIWPVTLWHVAIRSPRYSQVHLEIAKYRWKVVGCIIVENVT